MLPVGRVRLDQRPVVGQDRLERLRALGRRRGERRPERSGLDGRQDRVALDAFEVVGHEVHDGVGGRPERRRIHVPEAVELVGGRALGRLI